jgi:hypothetical protein
MSCVTGLICGSSRPAEPPTLSSQVYSHAHNPQPAMLTHPPPLPPTLRADENDDVAQLTNPACPALGSRTPGGGGIMPAAAAAASARPSPHSHVQRLAASSSSSSSSSTGLMKLFHPHQPHTISTLPPASFRPYLQLPTRPTRMQLLSLTSTGDV